VRGGPLRRGTITGVATGLGGMLHTFPFLIPNLGIALKLAYAVVVCELIAIAFIRYRFMGGKLANTIVQVVIGGGHRLYNRRMARPDRCSLSAPGVSGTDTCSS
jgi:hypothetical protein